MPRGSLRKLFVQSGKYHCCGECRQRRGSRTSPGATRRWNIQEPRRHWEVTASRGAQQGSRREWSDDYLKTMSQNWSIWMLRLQKLCECPAQWMNKDPHQRPLLWNVNIGFKEKFLKVLRVKTSSLKMTQSKKAGMKMPLYDIPTQKMRSQRRKAFSILEMIFNMRF